MALNPRSKGKRGEYAVRDMLREATNLNWERVPSSGAGHLKGDLFVPKSIMLVCLEVKNHAKEAITDALIVGSPILDSWWLQASESGLEPLLIFRKERGKWLAATYRLLPYKHIYYSKKNIYIYEFSDIINEFNYCRM